MMKEEKLKQMSKWMEERRLDMIEVYPFVVNNTVIHTLSLHPEHVLVYEDSEKFDNPLCDETTIGILYDMMKQQWELRHLNELSEVEIKKLLSQIRLNSLYVADYQNILGVMDWEVCHFWETFYEYMDCFFREDPESEYSCMDDFLDRCTREDLAQEFYNYLCDQEESTMQNVCDKHMKDKIRKVRFFEDWYLDYRPCEDICGKKGLAVFNSIR